jgi:hypothetical protein
MGRMARAARAGGGRATWLRVESLELRDTPAGLMASVSGGVVSGIDPASGTARFQVTPYPGFTGGINVAVGDVNGDGTADLITGAKAGGGPVVNVFDGTDGHLLDSFTAGDPDSRAGVGVAAADYDGDGKAELVVGSLQGGRPVVQVLRFPDRSVVKSYTPFVAAGGVSVAAGDVNGDGTPDTVIGAGPGAGPRVVVLDGKTDAPLLNFFAFEPSFTGGVGVAAGDVNGDGRADVLCAAGFGGGPRVQAFGGQTGKPLLNFFAYDAALRTGVSATLADTNADGRPDVVTSNGTGQPADPRAFDARTVTQLTAPAGLDAGPSDTTPPGVTLTTASAASATNASPIAFTATFSEAVLGFTQSDLQVTGGTLGNFTVKDARTYTFSVAPAAEGAVTVNIAADVATDAAGNPSTAGTLTRTYDTTAPTATVTSTASDQTGTTPIPFTVTFNEDVTGFTAADLTVTNGTVANFTATNARTYTFNVVPTAAGAVTVGVAAGVATDIAGNPNTAAAAITRTFTGAVGVSANALTTNDTTPTLTGTVGNSAATVKVQVGGQTVTATVTGTTWSATLPTALAAGTYDIVVTATLPNSGGTGAATLTGGLVIDTTAPTVAVTSSAAEPTSTAPVPFTVTFSEDVTGFTASDLQVTNGTVASFAAASGKTYTFNVVPTATGAITVNVAANAATDAAGSGNTAAPAFTRTFNTGAVGLTANPLTTTNNKPTLTGTVANSAATVSVQVGGQTVTATVTGTTWSATLPNTLADGTYTAVVTATLPGGGGTGSLTLTNGLVVDTTAPTVAVTSTAAEPTSTAPVPFTVTFSEDVTGFTASDLAVTNGTVVNFTATSGKTYTFNVVPTAAGAITVNIAAGAATDAAGNASTAAPAFTRTFNTGAVAVTANRLTTNDTTPTLTGTVGSATVVVKVQVGGRTVTATVSGTSWTATLPTALAAGTYDVVVTATLPNNGGTGTATLTHGLVVDTTAPTAKITSTAPEPTSANPVPFTVTFSEDVTGFTASDLVVTNGTVGNFTAVDAKTYTFTVTPTAPGAVTVNVAANAATDAAGNGNTAAPAFTRTFGTGAVPLTANKLTTDDTTPTLTGTVGTATATVTVRVGGQTVTATVTGTTWSATLPTALAAGTYDIVVTATLPAGGGTGSLTLTGGLVIDTTAPIATISSTAPERTNSAAIPFTVTFSEDVTGFTQGDLQVTGGTVGGFTKVDAHTYTFTVAPSADGTVTVNVAAGVAADTAGNNNTAASAVTRTFTTGAVALNASPLATTHTTPTLTGTVGNSAATVQVQVGGETIPATVTGTTWSATLPTALTAGTYDVVVTATLPGGGGTGSLTVTGGLVIDTTAPTATITSTATEPTSATSIPFTATFSEDVVGFTASDLTVTNGTVGNFTQVDAHTYTFTVAPVTGGAVTVGVAAEVAADAAGNPSAPVPALTRTFNPPADPTPVSVARDTAALATTMPPADSTDFVPLPGGNGLKVRDVVQGTGPAVATGNVVTIDYVGWLAFNGTQFDTSRTKAQPAAFDLDTLIQGWKLGIPGMRPGGVRLLYIPAALAYGSAGSGSSVPPNADLVFEIRLISSTP